MNQDDDPTPRCHHCGRECSGDTEAPVTVPGVGEGWFVVCDDGCEGVAS